INQGALLLRRKFLVVPNLFIQQDDKIPVDQFALEVRGSYAAAQNEMAVNIGLRIDAPSEANICIEGVGVMGAANFFHDPIRLRTVGGVNHAIVDLLRLSHALLLSP